MQPKTGKQAPAASWRGKRGCPEQRMPESNQRRRVNTSAFGAGVCQSIYLLPAKGWRGLPWWLRGKESACQCGRQGFDPWVGKIRWRRKWQPTPVCLPGEFHGQRSLVGYSPCGHKESEQPINSNRGWGTGRISGESIWSLGLKK